MENKIKNQNNKVHVYGFVNYANIDEPKKGSKERKVYMIVTTEEDYEKNGANQKKYTKHEVFLKTDNLEVLEKFQKIASDLQEKKTAEDKKGYSHTISVDGRLTSKGIRTDENQIAIDRPKQEEERRNRADLTGKISEIYLHDNFAKVIMTTVDKIENKTYETKVAVNVSDSRLPEEFEKIKSGDINIGDEIKVNGQMHNNDYKNKEGKEIHSIDVDLRAFTRLSKKEEVAESVEQAPAVEAEVKKEEKKAKKATPNKKATAAKKEAPKKKTGVKL